MVDIRFFFNGAPLKKSNGVKSEILGGQLTSHLDHQSGHKNPLAVMGAAPWYKKYKPMMLPNHRYFNFAY